MRSWRCDDRYGGGSDREAMPVVWIACRFRAWNVVEDIPPEGGTTNTRNDEQTGRQKTAMLRTPPNRSTFAWRTLGGVQACLTLVLFVAPSALPRSALLHLWPIASGQMTVLAVWAVFSPGNPFKRAIGYTVLFAVIGLSVGSPGTRIEELFTLLPAVAWNLVTGVFPMMVGKRVGWRITTRDAYTNRRWNLSLATLMALTGLVALLIVLRQTLAEFGSFGEDGNLRLPTTNYSWIPFTTFLAASLAGSTALTLSALWSCLGNLTQLPATFLVLVLVCLFPLHLNGGSSQLWWTWAVSLSMFVVILSLLLLRSLGLRLHRDIG
ncbi:MAG: hypothetical protein AAGF97_18340 [Planctomycetota bacterium]